MTKVINKNAKLRKDANTMAHSKAVRSMAKYIRTHGEYRDGLTTSTDGGALVPTEIVNAAEDLGSNKFQLKPYLTTVPVTSSKGDYPVMNPTATANTKDELAKYPDLADNGINNVPFKIQSYAGRIQISQELLDDSETALTPILSKDLSTIAINTQNKIIAEKMATLPATNVSSLDDVVKAITEDVDPRFAKNMKIFVGQSAYGKLRTMKDSQNRYLLDSNANTICGVPVVIMPNFGNNADDIYVGDLASAMAYFDRGNVSVNYSNNNLFSKSMAMVMRADVEITYAPALKHLTLSDGTAK